MSADEQAAAAAMSEAVRHAAHYLPAVTIFALLAQLIGQFHHLAEEAGDSSEILADVEKANRAYGVRHMLGQDTIDTTH